VFFLIYRSSRTVKWAFFCQNPAFEGVNAEDIAAKVSRHRYVICSEHFVPTDYRDGKEGSSRNLNTGAVPTIYGSLFEDTLGDVISPIQPPKNKFQARLSGLLPNHSDSDSDNEFENMDYEEFCSKIENRFEERGENFTPPTLNLEQNHLSTKTNTPGTHTYIHTYIYTNYIFACTLTITLITKVKARTDKLQQSILPIY